jgi:hypothetical protein
MDNNMIILIETQQLYQVTKLKGYLKSRFEAPEKRLSCVMLT